MLLNERWGSITTIAITIAIVTIIVQQQGSIYNASIFNRTIQEIITNIQHSIHCTCSIGVVVIVVVVIVVAVVAAIEIETSMERRWRRETVILIRRRD